MNNMEDVAVNVADILSKVPEEKWMSLLERQPEYKMAKEMVVKKKKYSKHFGPFVTFMAVAALNDYQIKGKDEDYWYNLRNVLETSEVPKTMNELKKILISFYENERQASVKLKRLDKFFNTIVAEILWKSTPETVCGNIREIWCGLAEVDSEGRLYAKTVVFAVKAILEVVYLYTGKLKCVPKTLPIAVDNRVKSLTANLVNFQKVSDSIVREFWSLVLDKIKERKISVSIIHLDSLVWQIAPEVKTLDEMVERLKSWGFLPDYNK